MAAKSEKKTAERVSDESERKKAFDSALSLIEKQFGKGSIIRLGDKAVEDVPTIPSGSLLIDRALGVGGYPKGRIVEIFGPESSGKTTLALHAIAECQKQGGTAAFIDAEHAIDPAYAKNLGVNTESLWISQPDNGEQALEITEQLIRSGSVDIIVIDSVAALTPKAEIAGLMGDAQVGAQARLMSQALRKLTGIIHKTSCCLIFINQIRMKIGVMFGSPETTSGGNALKFYASVRIDVRRIERISQGTDNYIGNKVRIKVSKNKVAPPFKTADFSIYFGKGISRLESILELGTDLDLVQKSGSWYALGEEKIGQGKENAIEYLEQHPEKADELEKIIREKVFADPKAAKTAAASGEEKSAADQESPAASKKTAAAKSTAKSKSESAENTAASDDESLADPAEAPSARSSADAEDYEDSFSAPEDADELV